MSQRGHIIVNLKMIHRYIYQKYEWCKFCNNLILNVFATCTLSKFSEYSYNWIEAVRFNKKVEENIAFRWKIGVVLKEAMHSSTSLIEVLQLFTQVGGEKAYSTIFVFHNMSCMRIYKQNVNNFLRFADWFSFTAIYFHYWNS